MSDMVRYGVLPNPYTPGVLVDFYGNPITGGGGAAANVVYTASGTAGTNETSIITGNATGQALTLPSTGSAAVNTVKNFGTERWLLGPAVLGPGSAFGFIALVPGDSVTLAFIQGTGWYPVMTQQGQSQGVFNLQSWGCDPTGSSACDADIQGAQAQAAAQGGGFLYTPPGCTFKLNNPITMGNAVVNRALTGSGSGGTSLHLTTSAAALFSGLATPTPAAPLHLCVWIPANTTAVVVTCTGLSGNNLTVSSTAGITAAGLIVTVGSVSTQNNVSLLGPSLGSHTRFGALAYGGPPGSSWIAGSSFPNGVNMVQFNGPMSGGGVENMYFNCNSIAGGGVQLIGHQAGVFKNITVQDYDQNAYWLTSVSSFYDETSGIIVTPLTFSYDMENCGGYSTVSGKNLTLYFLAADELDLASMTNNTSYGHISKVQATLQDPGTGFLSNGFYCRGCDNVTVWGGNFIASQGTNGEVWPIVLDYTVPGVPESCIFDGLNPGQGFTDPVLAAGTVQASPNPNIFANMRGGCVKPSRFTGQYDTANKWLSDSVNGNY